MPYDPLMRWETEGGAILPANGGGHGRPVGPTSGSGRPPEILAATSPWDQAAPRRIEPEDWLRFRSSLAEILVALGMDLETPGTERTPERFLQALYDATAGYEGDPKLLTAFATECRCDDDCLVGQIVEGPISFHSLCEHHALPFHGVAHVGYVAHERIIGISKLTRLVRVFARRFTVQERLGEQIADTLVELLEPHGVAVRLEAAHLCTQMRGVREERSKTVTTFWRGLYTDEPDLRRDFLADLGNRNP
jgi:GTP cyclohydrolase I